MVRAKFYVKEIHDFFEPNSDRIVERTVRLHVAYGKGNESWSKWTPQGELWMKITNPDAFNRFAAGKFFYVDFSEAPATDP